MRTALRTLNLLTSSFPRSPSQKLAPSILNAHIRTMASAASPVLQKPVKLACIQLMCGADKQANLDHARAKVLEAAKSGAKIIVLPEIFNSLYGTKYFPEYAEPLLPSPPARETSPSFHALSSMAAEAKAYLIGGSIPEVEEESSSRTDGDATTTATTTKTKKYYNTSLTFGPDGALLSTHRKTHLFDIDIPGKITFRESDVLSPGNKITTVDLPGYGRIGIAICYDVRFPELATIAARKGRCFALVYPGAFNLTTGPLHWRMLAQARAVDNQLYVAMCSPARDVDGPYQAWGHSMILDPMAQVVAETDEKEGIVEWELDGARIDEVRRNIPLGTQRRFDVYPDVSEGEISFEEPGAPGR